MKADKPIVLVRIQTNGDTDYLITEGVTLLVVDENSVSDRVYHYQSTTPLEEIAAVVGDSPIGKLGDRPEQENAIRHVMETGKLPGERGFLEIVPQPQGDGE